MSLPQTPPRRRPLVTAFAWIVVCYVVAGVVAWAVAAHFAPGRAVWQTVAIADVAATIVVFAFSVVFNNSSFYDPYWSVAPMVIVASLAACSPGHSAGGARNAVVVLLVFAWGLRLTYNWARGWSGLAHEDWRYVDLRRQFGRAR